MSAEAALSHPYFRSLGERVHQLEDSECLLEVGGGARVTPEPKKGGSRCGWKSGNKEASGPGPAEQPWAQDLLPCVPVCNYGQNL